MKKRNNAIEAIAQYYETSYESFLDQQTWKGRAKLFHLSKCVIRDKIMPFDRQGWALNAWKAYDEVIRVFKCRHIRIYGKNEQSWNETIAGKK